MNDEPMGSEELFHTRLFYFLEALNVLAMDASAQCDVMGNFNVAREIQQDARDGAVALSTSSDEYLSPAEKEGIAKLLTPLDQLPEAALLRHEHAKAMNHPAWEDLRKLAIQLLDQLSAAAERNRRHFKNLLGVATGRLIRSLSLAAQVAPRRDRNQRCRPGRPSLFARHVS